MKWLEIIKIRTVGEPEYLIVTEMLKKFRSLDDGTQPMAVKLYHHATVESDLCIHIYWNSETMPPRKSPMGLRIVDALGILGVVNHSLWIEDTVGFHAPPPGSR